MVFISQVAQVLLPSVQGAQLERMMHPTAETFQHASLAPLVKAHLLALHLLQTARRVHLLPLLLPMSVNAMQQAQSMISPPTRVAVLLALPKAYQMAHLFAEDAHLESTP
jgi:hypothetical protein